MEKKLEMLVKKRILRRLRQRKLIKFAFIGIFIWVAILILHLFFDGNPVIDFLYGATPGLLLGLTLLSFVLYLDKQKSNQEE